MDEFSVCLVVGLSRESVCKACCCRNVVWVCHLSAPGTCPKRGLQGSAGSTENKEAKCWKVEALALPLDFSPLGLLAAAGAGQHHRRASPQSASTDPRSSPDTRPHPSIRPRKPQPPAPTRTLRSRALPDAPAVHIPTVLIQISSQLRLWHPLPPGCCHHPSITSTGVGLPDVPASSRSQRPLAPGHHGA